MTTQLPVLPADDPCRGCGACCLHVVWPPYVPHYGGDPEWWRLERERPDLAEEILLAIDRAKDAEDEVVAPCCWYDPATRRCRNYEYRPQICRDFVPGDEACLRFRSKHGID